MWKRLGQPLSDAELLPEAKALGLDPSRFSEEALRKEVSEEKARRWRHDNAEAIALSNAQLARDGLWCDEYRLF
jgi:antitoxin CcdA